MVNLIFLNFLITYRAIFDKLGSYEIFHLLLYGSLIQSCHNILNFSEKLIFE